MHHQMSPTCYLRVIKKPLHFSKTKLHSPKKSKARTRGQLVLHIFICAIMKWNGSTLVAFRWRVCHRRNSALLENKFICTCTHGVSLRFRVLCVYRHTSSSAVPQNGPRARNQTYIKYVDVRVYWHIHMCPKTVPSPCFDCVKDACKISVNGHVRVGFNYSKGESRSFLYELKGYRCVLFC